MPLNALQDARVHYRLPASEVGGIVAGLVEAENQCPTVSLIPCGQPGSSIQWVYLPGMPRSIERKCGRQAENGGSISLPRGTCFIAQDIVR